MKTKLYCIGRLNSPTSDYYCTSLSAVARLAETLAERLDDEIEMIVISLMLVTESELLEYERSEKFEK